MVKGLIVDYYETIKVNGIKVCIYSTLNLYMEIYHDQGDWSFFDLCRSDFVNFKHRLP